MIDGPDRTPLPRYFFDRPVLEVAPDLLGRHLVRNTPDGPPGHACVHFTYGMSRRSA
ncbi:3-methyladenine DNA glycosylase [Streptomyces sp. AC1-42W]|nr:3-methyladenine DNA glycosylase [Streptomyces sp. AC1-42T]PZT82665.1 3-methyladenine DNA glycosylase [Streptomyces sp. AC1-42W]